VEFSLGVMGLYEYSMREFKRTLNVRGKALCVLPPSVDLPRRSVESTGRFVTFVNPLYEKGLDLFLELVRRFTSELPKQRFMVVESRGTAEQVRRVRGIDLHALPNVVVQPATRDMAAVYRRTKVLLVPSLWREAYGMVVTEAHLRGIPVLASSRGGLPEALHGACRPLPPLAPEDVPGQRRRVIDRWAGELRKILLDEQHHRSCVRAAKQAAAAYRRTQSPSNIHAAFNDFYQDMTRRRLSAEHDDQLARFRTQLGIAPAR
jgi:glycosyltransferase involved in cell wall biosynthesis